MKTTLPFLSILLGIWVCGLFSHAGAAEKADPVGTWKCAYMIGDQPRTATLTLKQDSNGLMGAMSWPEQKEATLKDVKLKDNELTFSAVRELGDKKYTVDYKFTIDGDKLTGKGAVANEGKKTEFDITGQREKKDK